MPVSPFEETAAILPGLVPDACGELRVRARRYGIKVWFGPVKPPREHYEAQVIGPSTVPDASVLAIEVGFHAEYPDEADNEAVVTSLLGCEAEWRPAVGDEAVAGRFLGADHWRRVSETWPDPDLGDEELPFELATRLVDYVIALEPARGSPTGVP